MALILTDNSFSNDAEALVEKNAAALKRCFSDFDMTGWLNAPEESLVTDILKTAEKIQKSCDTFVVCGIGGSALGARAVHTALCGVYYNGCKDRKTPKLFIEDNIDPARVQELLNVIDIKKTVFNFISKSGTTLETAAQLSLFKEKLTEAGLDAAKHMVFTLGNTTCEMYRYAAENSIKVLLMPANVGGRFSVFTAAGLLPLAVTGINIRELLAGAYPQQKNSAALAQKFAAINYLAAEGGKSVLAFMPYIGSFKYISEWFVQLWAESLGKGGKGQTPVAALGTTDQHSMLQLFMDGPNDKIIVFVETKKYAAEMQPFNKIQTAALAGVRQALTEQKRANLTLTLPDVSPAAVGELLMFLMLATGYSGALYGINPYDQPGVEAGKIITKKLLENKNPE